MGMFPILYEMRKTFYHDPQYDNDQQAGGDDEDPDEL